MFFDVRFLKNKLLQMELFSHIFFSISSTRFFDKKSFLVKKSKSTHALDRKISENFPEWKKAFKFLMIRILHYEYYIEIYFLHSVELMSCLKVKQK